MFSHVFVLFLFFKTTPGIMRPELVCRGGEVTYAMECVYVYKPWNFLDGFIFNLGRLKEMKSYFLMTYLTFLRFTFVVHSTEAGSHSIYTQSSSECGVWALNSHLAQPKCTRKLQRLIFNVCDLLLFFAKALERLCPKKDKMWQQRERLLFVYFIYYKTHLARGDCGQRKAEY